MRKKKIFLGGYINHLSAQNINCKSIALHLDKDKYNVRTLVLGNMNIPKIKEVSFYKVSNFLFSISNTFSFVKGIVWADVCYVPKHQFTPRIALKIAPFFGTKLFTTIEGNMCDKSRVNMINSFGTLYNMIKYFSLIPNIFGITNHIIKNANCGVQLNKKPLFLGVEKQFFLNNRSRSELKNIVFIGSLIKRKNVNEFVELAVFFPDLIFNIVGNGPLKAELEFISTSNVVFHNKLNHTDLSILLQDMDLHFLPSKSEGFPKVILEAACASVPSVVYDSYGASDWLLDLEDGFIISNFNEIKILIANLIKNPKILVDCSEKVVVLTDRFNWENIIIDWENTIDNLR